MKQGTISILIGCHSIIHSFLVLEAWIRLYKRLPLPWQAICIFLHDIGHYGRDYLDDESEKDKHWILGAEIAGYLFGDKGYDLVAGHCERSGLKQSDLYKADKYSWYIAPRWWCFLNTITEPKLRMGYTRWEAVNKFKEQVAKSIESGEFKSTHSLYLERCKELE